MEIIVKGVTIAILIAMCCYCISQNVNKELLKHLGKQKDLNKQILGLYQNERKEEIIICPMFQDL